VRVALEVAESAVVMSATTVLPDRQTLAAVVVVLGGPTHRVAALAVLAAPVS